MPGPLLSPLDTQLALITESQIANPAQQLVFDNDTTFQTFNIEPIAVTLRGPHPAFRDLEVPDIRQQQIRQYFEDEKEGILAQARALVERTPKSVIAWARYAQTLASFGELKSAVQAAHSALSQDSDEQLESTIALNFARFVAARVLMASNDLADAERVLGRLTGEGPWTILYAALAEQRGEHHEALARLAGSGSADASAFRGFLLLQVGETQHAIGQLRSALRAGLNSPSIQINLAFAYAVAGSLRKAVRAAQQAVMLDPYNRDASFSLASYLRADGRIDDSLDELKRLRQNFRVDDIKITQAIAETYAVAGRLDDSLRELRRVQHHNDFPPGSKIRAELITNTAVLEWAAGTLSHERLVTTIQDQLNEAGAHLPLVTVLADCVNRTSIADEISGYYVELSKTLPGNQLAPLASRLQLLRGNIDEAAKIALEHVKKSPLDLGGIRWAMSLCGYTAGSYETVIKLGWMAHSRFPSDRMVLNGLAYFLTLDGRADVAHQLLSSVDTENDPVLLATRGAIWFGLGEVRKGLRCYDDAAQLFTRTALFAKEVYDLDRLVRVYEALVLRELNLAKHHDVPAERLTPVLPDDWRSYPSYLLLRSMASRLGLQWE